MFHPDPSTKALFVTYVLTLGFQRLTFATGNRTFWPWVFLLLTHVVEAWMWWTLGLEAGYMTGYLNVQDMVKDIATFNHVKPFSFILLLVPAIVGLFLIAGPESEKKKKQN